MTKSLCRAGVAILAAGAFLTLAADDSAVATNTNKQTNANQQVTFAKDVVRIFQEKCQDCHRPGSVAPMPLETYEQARPWARSIKERVVTRQMPPWHLDKNVGIQHFKNDMSLSDDQIATIVKWVDSGSPMGDPKDLPPLKTWPSNDVWKLAGVLNRPPDMVITSEEYTMPAVSQDQWWRPITQIHVKEPVWVMGVEMRTGTDAGRKITHHALAHLVQDDPEAQKYSDDRGFDARNPDEAGTLMEWAVGKSYDLYTPNTGKLILPGSHIWWDIHYHAVGQKIQDHVELGVWLYPKGQEPKYRTYLTGFQATQRVGSKIDIPPNTIAQEQGYTVLKAPAKLENFQPHMHLRGKAMAIEAILPDGRTKVLSFVDHFNFNWMTNYIYADDAAPVLPKGTIIHVTAWYDNTAGNKFNPNPNQWVGYGDRTVDEMGHAWVNVTYISDEEYKQWSATHKGAFGAMAESRAANSPTATTNNQ